MLVVLAHSKGFYRYLSDPLLGLFSGLARLFSLRPVLDLSPGVSVLNRCRAPLLRAGVPRVSLVCVTFIPARWRDSIRYSFERLFFPASAVPRLFVSRRVSGAYGRRFAIITALGFRVL